VKDIAEQRFEDAIEAALLGDPSQKPPGTRAVREAPLHYAARTGGYRKRRPEDYERARCLDPGTVLDFIVATQPREWQKLAEYHGAEVKERFLARLAAEVVKRGTLDVLRRGVKDSGCTFRLAFFPPASGLNEETQRLYQANLFTVIRQLRYSQKTGHTLDLTLFLNGLPIFTAELKNPLTGQNVQHAVAQYRADRDPREPLFAFGRCLAHFAVDPDFVFVATHLRGRDTVFLPFNQGWNSGAGNPPAWNGFATAYLWESIWSRESVLNLVQYFIQVVEHEDDKGRKTGARDVIFPRYHQLDAMRRLLADAGARGPGQRYLIQHSAGSGKSNSIAWLAHQLTTLHDADDRRVFDTIVVVTDRRVLDRQIRRTVRQFEQVPGVVEAIEQDSRQLREALEAGKNIVVTTVQKFPFIVEHVGKLPGQRFAVIVDEAHSSQRAESMTSLKRVLAVDGLEEAAREDAAEWADVEDRIIAAMKRRGHLPNVSMFAFTATPKPETMQVFGTRRPDGSYEPFSLYSMRQAIEETFILDVLENYTTYATYWKLLKTTAEDPRYDRARANQLLTAFVSLHEHAIASKVRIMVDHFAAHTAARIGGKAKAMIVTRSRLHAVRYKGAVDRYLKERGLPYKALVAFSGTVRDPETQLDYTEAAMNGFPESQTAETFKQDAYRFLIVAEKFQTGFDQPLLHTMYVDKRLAGVNAVQTLSRLNRVHPAKEETMVLDFANEAEEIRQSFQPYYDRTILSEGSDPNALYDLQRRLAGFGFFSLEEVETFTQARFAARPSLDRLYAALSPVVERYSAAGEHEREAFRGALSAYTRLYAFLSQVTTFVDADLEKLHEFARLLLRRLPVRRDELPAEIQQAISMESYRIQKTAQGPIKLSRGSGVLEPALLPVEERRADEELEQLSRIISDLNERFGTDFTENDRVLKTIRRWEEQLDSDAALEATVKVNTTENAQLTFDIKARDHIEDLVQTDFALYKKINGDPDYERALLDHLFRRYLERSRTRAAVSVPEREPALASTGTLIRHPGWPPGFIERTAGAWQGEPPVRPGQGDYEEREPIE
jgi:type I restriction enzyme R subunit